MNRFRVINFEIFLYISVYVTVCMSTEYDYTKAFEKSIYFYECQVSGEKPSWNRCDWRGNSGMADGSDYGIDLTGGWYDAGDHVKFGFPLASTVTLLAIGFVEYTDVFEKQGQKEHFFNNLKWVNDYFIKCHTKKFEFWGQVGNSHLDHGWWGPAEKMAMNRPAYKIDVNNPGSELAGETAAAMAASAIAFKKSNFRDDEYGEYSTELIRHAVELYEFAETYQKKYHESIKNAQGCYQSWSGWFDELVWAGIWLYLATNNKKYLDKAEFYYDSLGVELGTGYNKFKWTHCWDDKTYGCYVFLARLTGKERYLKDTERWLDFWTCGFENFKIKYTPGGLAWLDRWGVLRYSANTSLFALMYSDYLKGVNGNKEKIKRYSDFGYSQINYILGDNPLNRSFVCGVGNNPPVNPHHRSAHGSERFMITEPKNNRFPLDGALVGGPDQNDNYKDDRTNYEMNEVACDYNAAFTSVLARIIGGEKVVNKKNIRSFGKHTYKTEINTRIINSSNPIIHYIFKLKNSEHVTITLFTFSGKQIRCVIDKQYPPGIHSLNYTMKNYPSGTYIIVIKTEKTYFSKFLSLL